MLILSKKARLDGYVTILPLTSKNPDGAKNAYQIQASIMQKQSWIICDYIITVSVARLIALPTHKTAQYLPQEEFAQVLALLHRFLPQAE